MPDRPWKDEYTLLCEKCGYVIEGLDQSGNCPECGKPIIESLPERRVGTPWQQRRGLGSLFKTWYRVIRHPRRTMDEIQLQSTPGEQLTLASLTVSSILAAIGVIPWALQPDPILSMATLIFTLLLVIIYGITSFLIISLFCLIGRISANKRGYRTLTVTAWQITGHGSVFSIFIPLGVMLGIWCGVLASRADNALYILLGIQTDVGPVLRWIAGIALPMGFLVAIVGFAMFVYHCEYRNRFANRIKPEEAADG